jgi:LysM repeat protein
MAILAGLAGCATFNDSTESTAEQEDINILREDLNRVQGQMETVALENRRMVAEVEKLRAASANNRDQSATQERMDNLERQIQTVNAAREKDKQAIVDQLSAKIAEIMSKGSSRPASASNHGPRTSPGSSATPAGGSAAGAAAGEHNVKAGETLSSIAAAYKVKASAIIDANGLTDPDHLKAGQKLVIPR